MSETGYLDLPDFGLRLVPSEDARFPILLNEILEQPQPFPRPVPDLTDLHRSTVLLNESGKAIVALSMVWRYAEADGHQRTSRLTNLSSSTQLEILTGRRRAEDDLHTSILAGSKRLVTERGLFGNNSDVLPSNQRGGICGGFGGGTSSRRDGRHELLSTELSVDFAILEDGLCVGPDTSGMFASLLESLELQRTTADKAARALRSGASEGQVFDLILPLARMTHREADAVYRQTLLPMFTRMAIHQLVDGTRDEQLLWFERFAKPSDFTLRKAG